jgi:Family of unknown function (DUF6325)
MAHGPVECAIVEFPGSKVKGGIAPVLKELIASGTIRIVDLAFVRKDEDDHVEPLELSQLDLEDAKPYEELDGEIDDLINREDIQTIAEGLPSNTIAAVFVWEDVWDNRFADAVQSAQGHMVANERIPQDRVEAAFAAAATASA